MIIFEGWKKEMKKTINTILAVTSILVFIIVSVLISQVIDQQQRIAQILCHDAGYTDGNYISLGNDTIYQCWDYVTIGAQDE